MSDSFDPYYQWLGISPRNQPADHYRLLGVEAFEPHPDVIAAAADQRIAHVRTFQSGPRGKHSQKLLNELANARITLLDPKKRAAYDAVLREQLARGPQQTTTGSAAREETGSASEGRALAIVAPAKAPAIKRPGAPGIANVAGAANVPSAANVVGSVVPAVAPDVGPVEMAGAVGDAIRLLVLAASQLRLKHFRLPEAYLALGEQLIAKDRLRVELPAEFAAIEALDRATRERAAAKAKSSSKQSDSAAKQLETSKQTATGANSSGAGGPRSPRAANKRRESLLRALGAAAWREVGPDGLLPDERERLGELTAELASHESEMARIERARPGHVLSPRWMAIWIGSLSAAVVLIVLGVPLRFALLALMAAPIVFGAKAILGKMSSGSHRS